MTDDKKKGEDYVDGLLSDNIDGMMGKKKPKAKAKVVDYGAGYGSGGTYGSQSSVYRSQPYTSEPYYSRGTYNAPRRYGDSWGSGDAGRRSSVVATPTGASQRMARAAQSALDASEFVRPIAKDDEWASYDESDIRDIADGVAAVLLECAENANMTVRSGANVQLIKDTIAEMLVTNFFHTGFAGQRLAVRAVDLSGQEVVFLEGDGGNEFPDDPFDMIGGKGDDES